MMPVNGGRFCANCERTVIDFTGYNDTQLYNFLSKVENAHVCGMYLAKQLNRDLIPIQPHSRLYKLFIALGLSIVFLPVGNAYSQPPAVNVLQTVNVDSNTGDTITGKAPISGVVYDDRGELMVGAIIQIICGGLVKSGVSTNENGFFEILTIDPGRYTIRISSPTYISQQEEIIVDPHSPLQLTFKMALSKTELESPLIIGYRVPLIDRFEPNNKK